MLRFHIPGMACGGCAKGVTKAVMNADPKAKIEIDLATRHVRVDTAIAQQEVLAVLQQAGYPAEQPVGNDPV